MVNKEYAIAYKEVLEILKYIPKEDFNKIPNSRIEMYKVFCDKNYRFSYDPCKSLEEQKVTKRAKAIIGLLFRDYWATSVQREKIIARQQYERYKLEEEKKRNNILHENNSSKIIENNSNEAKNRFSNLPVSVKTENYFKKFFIYVKRLIFRK